MNLMFKWCRAPEMITLVLLIVSLAIGAATSPRFLDAVFLLDKTSQLMPIGFCALAMTFIIITGHIDLSVASGLLLTAVVAAIAFEQWHWPMAAVIPFAIVFGSLLGAINGWLITLLKLPSLVVTLGTLALYRGIAQVCIGNRSIGGFPSWFGGVQFRKLGEVVPLPLILFLVAAAVLAFILHYATFGRRVYALGTNEAATRYSGIHTGRITLVVFTLSGVAMGIGAVLLMSINRSIDQSQVRGQELLAITAVVLGGTSIFGGRGSVLGTVLAMLLLVSVNSAMGMARIRSENQLTVIGALLIGSILLTNLTGRLLQRQP